MNLTNYLLLAETTDYSVVIKGGVREGVWAVVGVCAIVCIVALIINIKLRFANPIKKPKGILFLAEFWVTFTDKFIENNIGKESKLAPYIGLLFILVPASFLVGLLGVETSAAIYSVTFSFAIVTFVLIHYTCLKYNGVWGWFKGKYLAPIFVFLPINLVSNFAPLISLSFRLFGNGFAGGTIMKVFYWATGELSYTIFRVNFNFIGPVLAAPLHMYFDLFGAFIQTLVFILLTVIFISLEKPEEEGNISNKGGN